MTQGTPDIDGISRAYLKENCPSFPERQFLLNSARQFVITTKESQVVAPLGSLSL